MLSLRRTSILCALGLVASGFAVASAVPASAEIFAQRWCVDTPAPCVMSATLNGTPIIKDDPNFRIIGISKQTLDVDFHYTSFIVTDESGFRDLGSDAADDVWNIVVNTGDLIPRDVHGRAAAQSAEVDRTFDPLGLNHLIDLTLTPAQATEYCESGCSGESPTGDIRIDFEIMDNTGAFDNREVTRGLEFWTNVQSISWLPVLLGADTASPVMEVELTNPYHLVPGGATFVGNVRFRLPFAMMKEYYGIPNPETMTSTSLGGVVAGGTGSGSISFSRDDARQVIQIDVTGVTFSTRRLRVKKGTITPTRPKIEQAKRVSPRKGKVTFTKAKPRGAKVTGYSVRCVSAKHTVRASGKFPTVAVTGLKRGRAYECKVRAKSKAGSGKYSKAKRLPK